MQTFSTVKHIWLSWAKLNYQTVIDNPEEILNSILWFSALIRIQNYLIMAPEIINSNVDRVLDIIDTLSIHKHFMTFSNLTDQYGNCFSFLKYCGIIAAIPKLWKVEIRNYPYDNPVDIEISYHRCDKPEGLTKSFYWKIIEDKFVTNNNHKLRWDSDLKRKGSLGSTLPRVLHDD